MNNTKMLFITRGARKMDTPVIKKTSQEAMARQDKPDLTTFSVKVMWKPQHK